MAIRTLSNGASSVRQFVFTSSIVIVLDLVSKHYALNFFPVIQNPGLPFGIKLPGFLNLLTIIILFVFFLFFYFRFFSFEHTPKTLGLIVGGALANIFDRLLDGKVLDFIDIGISIINLADIAIMGGIGILLVQNLKRKV